MVALLDKLKDRRGYSLLLVLTRGVEIKVNRHSLVSTKYRLSCKRDSRANSSTRDFNWHYTQTQIAMSYFTKINFRIKDLYLPRLTLQTGRQTPYHLAHIFGIL